MELTSNRKNRLTHSVGSGPNKHLQAVCGRFIIFCSGILDFGTTIMTARSWRTFAPAMDGMSGALSRLTKAKKIISVELSHPALEYQRREFADNPRIETIQGDAAQVPFAADFIYLVCSIQHTADPLGVLKRMMDNLKVDGELVVTFYMVTPATMILEPVRQVLKRLPKEVLWSVAALFAPIFMARKAGREAGFRNARFNAYDWFGSHHYQRYFVRREIEQMFDSIGIQPGNVLRVRKGVYKVRKGEGPALDDKKCVFGADA